MKIILTTTLSLLLALGLNAQLPAAYTFYDSEGRVSEYSQVLKAAKEADFTFFGELHDDPIAHWLEFRLCKDLYAAQKDKLVVGMEMFESDNQLIVNEYFSEQISEKTFEDECRLWGNYRTDYKPILDFAREKHLKFVASNVPRRYAAMVNSLGLAAFIQQVEANALPFCATLPFAVNMELQCYKEMLEMGGGNTNFPEAQAIKDATMAENMLLNVSEGTEVGYHLNGSFHSNRKEGIIWYILQARPKARICNIATVKQSDLSRLDKENIGLADFILVTPDDMTTTH